MASSCIKVCSSRFSIFFAVMGYLDFTRDGRLLLPLALSGSASAFARKRFSRDRRRSRKQRGSVSHPQYRPLAFFTTGVLHETTQHWHTAVYTRTQYQRMQVVTCTNLMWTDLDKK